MIGTHACGLSGMALTYLPNQRCLIGDTVSELGGSWCKESQDKALAVVIGMVRMGANHKSLIGEFWITCQI